MALLKPCNDPCNFSNQTPGITRRALNVITGKFTMTFSLIRGQVHAVVSLRGFIY
jgi:hypothetical protein